MTCECGFHTYACRHPACGSGYLGWPGVPKRPTCAECKTPAEEWWSYCAMCGHHIAAGQARNLHNSEGK